MISECMMKKAKQQSPFMGVLTRSKTLALQRLQKESDEFLQLGSRRLKKQRRSESSNLSMGKGKSGTGRKRKAEAVEKRGLKFEEGLGNKVKGGEKDNVQGDLGRVDSGVLDASGGAPLAIGASPAAKCVIVGGSVIAAGDDEIIVGGCDAAAGGAVDAAQGGTAAISGCDVGEGAELGGGFILGDNILLTGGNDRVSRESTPEHLIIRPDYTRNPCSSMKGAKAAADERPQTVGGNSHQHKKLTTGLLLQENSNYAPSMDKYNFDFENEKPLPGRFEWEKVQP